MFVLCILEVPYFDDASFSFFHLQPDLDSTESGPHAGFRHEASQDHSHHAGFEKVARLLNLLEEKSAKSLLQVVHEYTCERL